MNSRSIEDLPVGSWVAVVAVQEDEPQSMFEQMGPMIAVRQKNPDHWANVDGRPYQIHAISLPFIALYCPVNKHLFPADYRRVELTLLDESYVKAFAGARATQHGLVPGDLPAGVYAHQKPSVDEDGEPLLRCHLCHRPMEAAGNNAIWCPHCGSAGIPTNEPNG